MQLLRLLAIAAVATTLTAAPARAQSASLARSSGAPVASQMQVGVRKSQPAPLGAPKAPRADTKQNRSMMIVGGAAMLTGAVVGGDGGGLISVGGAVVFLWGLYQFLQ